MSPDLEAGFEEQDPFMVRPGASTRAGDAKLMCSVQHDGFANLFRERFRGFTRTP